MPARRVGAVLRHKTRMLPQTVPSWMGRATCASHGDPDLWFAERGEEARRREALRICAACPVRVACLAYVLSMPPQAGIWGGTTEEERIRILPSEAERADRKKVRQTERDGWPEARQRRRDRERDRHRRLREAAVTGDATAISALERERARKAAHKALTASRERTRRWSQAEAAEEAGQ
jgi:WhiB family redox-sensing transcriptional regulator